MENPGASEIQVSQAEVSTSWWPGSRAVVTELRLKEHFQPLGGVSCSPSSALGQGPRPRRKREVNAELRKDLAAGAQL